LLETPTRILPVLRLSSFGRGLLHISLFDRMLNVGRKMPAPGRAIDKAEIALIPAPARSILNTRHRQLFDAEVSLGEPSVIVQTNRATSVPIRRPLTWASFTAIGSGRKMW
jgi:hypothetical protein